MTEEAIINRMYGFINGHYDKQMEDIENDRQYTSGRKKILLDALELERKESIVNAHMNYLNSEKFN